jgi:hypothetical protein
MGMDVVTVPQRLALALKDMVRRVKYQVTRHQIVLRVSISFESMNDLFLSST